LQRINDGARNGREQVPGRDRRLRAGLRATLVLLVLAGFCAPAGWAGPRRKGARAAAGTGLPQLVVAQQEVDLGDLPKGSSSVARFELQNTGTADLEILDVLPSCGCTVVTFDEVIPPGGVGSLTATLHTETLVGEVAKGITLLTNDPAASRAHLLIRAAVVTAVRVLPDLPIVLRNDGSASSIRRLIRRSSDSGHGFFIIAGLRATAPWLRARARKVREVEAASDGLPAASVGDWILEVSLEGQPPYGNSHQQVSFSTGLDRQPTVTLAILAEVAAPVQLPVERLLLPEIDGSAGGTLAFAVREGLDPSGLRIEAQPAGLGVELRPGTGRAFEARVRWKGGPLVGGKLIFRVGDEVYEIPVALASAG